MGQSTTLGSIGPIKLQNPLAQWAGQSVAPFLFITLLYNLRRQPCPHVRPKGEPSEPSELSRPQGVSTNLLNPGREAAYEGGIE